MDNNYYNNTYKTNKSSTTKSRPKSHNKLYLILTNKKINKEKINEVNKNNELPNLKLPNILSNNLNNKALSEANKKTTESDIKEKIRIYKELLFKDIIIIKFINKLFLLLLKRYESINISSSNFIDFKLILSLLFKIKLLSSL